MTLDALSPLDGRYNSQLGAVAKYFSEFALIRYRLKVEVLYLLFLADQRLFPKISQLNRKKILKISESFSIDDAQEIKTIEKETKHDVKAVEYFIRRKLEKLKLPVEQFVHVGLTSEDTNSLAQSLMVKDALREVMVSQLNQVLKQLSEMANESKDAVLLARTHGQAAVPTTMGKELMVFATRLCQELQELTELKLEAKLSGAVGNFSAQLAAFPKANWPKLSQNFILSLGLQPATLTTQIVPAETYTRIFSSFIRINSILLDLDQDIWRYISDGYFIQHKSKNQVGSSTMPHKINPIDFENSEGNLGLANSLFGFFIQKLPISRLQRDLSDSTVKRSIGSAFGYSYLAYSSLLKGLGKITLDQARLQQEIEAHWEVVAEPFQVILRVHGDTQGYEKLKAFSQGKHITEKDVVEFIDSLTVSAEVRKQLKAVTPQTYVGLAPELTTSAKHSIDKYLNASLKNSRQK